MCGISAVVSLSPGSLDSSITAPQNIGDGSQSSKLDQSLETIKHRGPDARDTWTSKDGRVALGHVRLAINDLSLDGEQPFHSSDDHVHAVVNGELYDADTIRQRLVKEAGATFKGKSDSEIVIALYQIYGTSFLRHLRGEFALCLYDSRTKFFIAARDRYGIKPLFFTQIDGNLHVAAEMKAFSPFGWNPEWDVRSVLDRRWLFGARTQLDKIRKIKPGSYFTCDATGYIEHMNYWDVEYSDKYVVEHRSEQELINGVRERLLDAVRVRLQADVPVGIFLSGGIDSSVIAGMVTHLVKTEDVKLGINEGMSNINCYTVGFDEDSGFDESEIARRTAQFLGVNFYKTHMSEQVLADNFEEATWHIEHTMPDLNYIGKYVLSKAPREHGIKVVLTGEGADEHFGGYPVFLSDYFAEFDHSWPAYNLSEAERDAIWKNPKHRPSQFFKIKNAAEDGNKMKSTSAASTQLNNISTLESIGGKFPNIFNDWTAELGEYDPKESIANNVDGRVKGLIAEKWHPLHTAEYIWTKGFLANAILTSLGDRAEMAHSLEARPPFLDHPLTEYVNQIPPSLKIRWDPVEQRATEKWILREACKPFITKEIYERKKHVYSAPPAWPIDGPLHKLMKRLVTQENIEQLGFVQWNKVKGIVPNAFENRDESSFRLSWTLAQWVVLSKRFGVRRAEACS
ncbi:asparagine synthase, partial [Aureobasidium melanogenum]